MGVRYVRNCSHLFGLSAYHRADMTTLNQEQESLKAKYEALKARHPYPGGWRDFTVSDAFALTKNLALLSEPLEPSFIGDERVVWVPIRAAKDGGICLVLSGRVMASRRWILANVIECWSRDMLRTFLFARRLLLKRQVYKGVQFYDLEKFIEAFLVMRKSRVGACLATPVARVLQGSGSINEKLLEFVAQSE